MLKDWSLIKNRQKRFIKVVCETGIVYGLKNEEGFATSSSIHYDDENGEPMGMICFWAEKSLANSCIMDEWSGYEISPISISDFIENWCVGMSNDDLLVGIEFDNQMFGCEVEPLVLIGELISELKRDKKTIDLKKYDDLSSFERQVRAIING